MNQFWLLLIVLVLVDVFASMMTYHYIFTRPAVQQDDLRQPVRFSAALYSWVCSLFIAFYLFKLINDGQVPIAIARVPYTVTLLGTVLALALVPIWAKGRRERLKGY